MIPGIRQICPPCRNRTLKQQCPAGTDCHQPAIGRGRKQRLVRVRVTQFLQSQAGIHKIGNRLAQPPSGHRQLTVAAVIGLRTLRVEIIKQFLQRSAISHRQFAHHEVNGLNAIGPLVNRQDAGIAVVLGGAGLLHITHPAMHLQRQRGHFDTGFRPEIFCQRCQQGTAFFGTGPRHVPGHRPCQ